MCGRRGNTVCVGGKRGNTVYVCVCVGRGQHCVWGGATRVCGGGNTMCV